MASLFGAPVIAAASVAGAATSNPPAGASSPAVQASPAAHFDLNPPVVLMKGNHNPTFLICWHSQRDLIGELAWKSALYIWGGPILALVSLGFVLSRFGLW